jgi:CO/xanthine dehydrogenase FAD-binding subunit
MEKGKDGRVQGGRIIFSAVGSGPVETSEAEKMVKGTMLADESIEKVSAQVGKEVSPMRTSLASPAYKRKMAGILLQLGLQEIRDAR